MMRQLTRIEGSCHCRNMRFVLMWPDASLEIQERKCGCTFCQKHSGAWTSHRDAELIVEIDDHSSVSKYQFGTKTADFYLCSICGVVPFVLSDIEGKQYAVVNVNAFENARDLSLTSSSTNFDGEDSGTRLERRRRNWIRNVQIN